MRAFVVARLTGTGRFQKRWPGGGSPPQPVFRLLPVALHREVGPSAVTRFATVATGLILSSDGAVRPLRQAPACELLLPLPPTPARLSELENRHLDYYAEQSPLHPDAANMDPIVVLKTAATRQTGTRALSAATLDAALESLNRAGSAASNLTEGARREAVELLLDPGPRFNVLQQLSLFALSRLCRVASEAYVAALHSLGEAGARLAAGDANAARLIVAAEKTRRAALVVQRSLISVLKQMEHRGQVRLWGPLGGYQWIDSVWAILESHTVAAHVPAFREADALGQEVRQRALQLHRGSSATSSVRAVIESGAAAVEKSAGPGAPSLRLSSHELPAALLAFEDAPTSDGLVNACIASLGNSTRTVLGDLSGPMNYDFGAAAHAAAGAPAAAAATRTLSAAAELRELRSMEERANLTPIAKAVLRVSFGHELTHLVAATRLAAAWSLHAEHPLTGLQRRATRRGGNGSSSEARAQVSTSSGATVAPSAATASATVAVVGEPANSTDNAEAVSPDASPLASAAAPPGAAALAAHLVAAKPAAPPPSSSAPPVISRYSPSSDVCAIVNGDIYLRLWCKPPAPVSASASASASAARSAGAAAAPANASHSRGEGEGAAGGSSAAAASLAPASQSSPARSSSRVPALADVPVVPKPTPRLLLSMRLSAMLVQCSPASLPSLDGALSRCDAAAIAALQQGCLGPNVARLRREQAFLAIMQARRYSGAWSPAFSMALRGALVKHVVGAPRFQEAMAESIDSDAGKHAIAALAAVPEDLPSPLLPGAGPLRRQIPLPCHSGSPVLIADALSQSVRLLVDAFTPPMTDSVAVLTAAAQVIGVIEVAQPALRMVGEVQRRFGQRALADAGAAAAPEVASGVDSMPHSSLGNALLRSLPSAAVCAVVARFDADMQRAAAVVAAAEWPAAERWDAAVRGSKKTAGDKPRAPFPRPADMLTGLHDARTWGIPALAASRVAAALAAASDAGAGATSPKTDESSINRESLGRHLLPSLQRTAEARVLLETASDFLADWAALHHSVAASTPAERGRAQGAAYAGAMAAVQRLAHALLKTKRVLRNADAALARNAHAASTNGVDAPAAANDEPSWQASPEDAVCVTALRCEAARLRASHAHALLRLRHLAVLDVAPPPPPPLAAPVEEGQPERPTPAGGASRPGFASPSIGGTAAAGKADAAAADADAQLIAILAAAAGAVSKTEAAAGGLAAATASESSAALAAARGSLLASAASLAASPTARVYDSGAASVAVSGQFVTSGPDAAAAASASSASSVAALTAALSAAPGVPASASIRGSVPASVSAASAPYGSLRAAAGGVAAEACMPAADDAAAAEAAMSPSRPRFRRLLSGWMAAAGERLSQPAHVTRTQEQLRAAARLVDDVTAIARAAAAASDSGFEPEPESESDGDSSDGAGQRERGREREGIDVDEGAGPDAAAVLLAPRFDAATALLNEATAGSSAAADGAACKVREDDAGDAGVGRDDHGSASPGGSGLVARLGRVHARSCAMLLHLVESLCAQRGWAAPARDLHFPGGAVPSARAGEAGRLLPLPPHGSRVGTWLAWPGAKCALFFLRPEDMRGPPLEEAAAALQPLLSALPAHPRAMFAVVAPASARPHAGGRQAWRREKVPGLATALEQAGWAVAVLSTADGAVLDCVQELRQWQFMEKERGLPPDVAQVLRREELVDSGSLGQMRLSQHMPVIQDTIVRCLGAAGIIDRIMVGKAGPA